MHRNLKLQVNQIKDGHPVKVHSLDVNVGMNASMCEVTEQIIAVLKAAGITYGEPSGEE